MNENILNLVLKNVASNAKASASTPDSKSPALAKIISSLNKINQSSSDSVNSSNTAQELLIEYQLPIEEENLNITNSFLSKGVLPSKEEIENIKSVLSGIPAETDKGNLLENSVKSTIQGLDIKNEIIQETISDKVDEKSIQKLFKDLKTAIIKDKSIPANVRVEISNEIDHIQKEIEQGDTSKETNNNISSEKEISEKLKVASDQGEQTKSQHLVSIASKGLERINAIIEDEVSGQIQKDVLLQDASDLHVEIERLTNQLKSDQKDLVARIDSVNSAFIDAKKGLLEGVQNLLDSANSNDNSANQNVTNTLQAKIPEFLKLLNNSDEILEKFGQYISSFPQSQKNLEQSTSPSEASLDQSSKKETSNNNPLQSAIETTGEVSENIKNILNSLELTSTEDSSTPLQNQISKVFNQDSDQKEFGSLTNNPNFKLLTQVSDIAESLQDNLQAIKKVIIQTADLPASVSIKEIAKFFQDNYPQFFKSFDELNLAEGEFPELQKIRSKFSESKTKQAIDPKLSEGKKELALTGTLKTINLTQLSDELEKIELEHFKSNDAIQSLKKVHESVSKSETKLAVHQLLESSSAKPERFYAFEVSINPLQENRLAKLEVQQNRQTEDAKIKTAFSVNIEVDLSQTGAIKARLFSDENAKQIFLNFADNDFKKLAIENQDELQTQLKEIPFIAQLFFGNISTPAPINKKSASQDSSSSASVYKFDSLA